jgi:predicted transcriptional regulator
VLQLEVLLLLRERGGCWSPSEVADELRVTAHAVKAHARDLFGRGLLSHDAEGDRYAFAPRDERLRSLVDELSEHNESMRHVVIDIIFPGDREPPPSDGAGRGRGPDG